MNYINFIYITLTLSSVLFLCGYISKFFERVQILKLLTISGLSFVVEYLYISSLMLFFDLFRVKYVLLIILVVNMVLFLTNFKKTFHKIDFNIKKSLILIIIMLSILPFISLKSQSIATTYDAGLYGMKAIDLMYGETGSTKILSEYSLVNGETRDQLIALQKQQIGLNKKFSDQNIYKYEYHALPTWPALMALSGKMIGVTNISQVLSFLFFASALCLFYILQNLKAKKYSQYMAFFMFLFLPLGIYLAKNSLSEMLFVSIMLFSLLFITEYNSYFKIASGFLIGILGFVHFTMLPYFPAIFGLLLLLGIISKNKAYFQANTIFCTLFGVSTLYAYKVSNIYISFQLADMFGTTLSTETLFLIIMINVLICLCIQAFVYYLLKKDNENFFDIINTLFEKYGVLVIKIITVILLFFTLYNGYKLGFTDRYIQGEGGTWVRRSQYANQGLYSILYLNIISIIAATSFLSIPVIIYKIFNKTINWGYREKLIALMFLFALSVQTILRIDTPKNYYASRYFYIFIVPFALILVGLLIKSKKGAVIACTIALITGLPFNLLLLKSVEYNGNWPMVTDAVSVVEKGSVVLCDPNNTDVNTLLVDSLRQINENLVLNGDSVNSIKDIFPDRKMYYISQNPLTNKRFDKILDKVYTTSGEIAGSWAYPLQQKEESINLYIYKISQKKTIINMQTEDLQYIHGFYDLEKNGNQGFAWSGPRSSFTLYFEPKGTTNIRIHHCALPPFVFTQHEKINVSFKIGQQVILSEDITAQTNTDGYFDLKIPEELLRNEWKHEITIESDTWSPLDFSEGKTDARKMGIPITKIEVVEE